MSSRVLIWFSIFIPVSYALQVQHNTFHSKKKIIKLLFPLSNVCTIKCMKFQHVSRGLVEMVEMLYFESPLYRYYRICIIIQFQDVSFCLCYSIWYCIQFSFGLTYRIQSNKKACECNVFFIVLYVLKWFLKKPR